MYSYLKGKSDSIDGGSMKYLIVLIMLSLPVSSSGTGHEIVIYVDDAYKPYSYQSNGRAEGIYIDVLRAAFAKMQNFKIKLLPVPWKRGKQLMKLGKGVGLTPAFFHGHDWPYLYPYSLPFYTETIIVVCTERILQQPRPNWPLDYKGLIIGNVAGFDGWGGQEFRELVERGEITYREVGNPSALIGMLAKNRHDCIMMETRAFDYHLSKIQASKDTITNLYSKLKKGALIGTDPVYIGYSETAIKSGHYPQSYAFRKAFDAIIYQMLKSGEVERIMDAYKD